MGLGYSVYTPDINTQCPKWFRRIRSHMLVDRVHLGDLTLKRWLFYLCTHANVFRLYLEFSGTTLSWVIILKLLSIELSSCRAVCGSWICRLRIGWQLDLSPANRIAVGFCGLPIRWSQRVWVFMTECQIDSVFFPSFILIEFYSIVSNLIQPT